MDSRENPSYRQMRPCQAIHSAQQGGVRPDTERLRKTKSGSEVPRQEPEGGDWLPLATGSARDRLVTRRIRPHDMSGEARDPCTGS